MALVVIVLSSLLFPMSATPSTSLPAARRSPCLHFDELECVFSLLNLKDLGVVSCVCTDWRYAVTHMAPIPYRNACTAPQTASLKSVCHGALMRHVRWIQSSRSKVPLTPAMLFVFSHRLTSLVRLHWDFVLSDAVLQFPPTLTHLDFNLALPSVEQQIYAPRRGLSHADSCRVSSKRLNSAVESIARLPLLKSLALSFQVDHPDLSFASLARCKSLRAFHFSLFNAFASSDVLTDRQVDEIRQLTWLETFQFSCLDVALMRRLLRAPHQLQWTSLIGFPQGLTAEIAEELRHLPSLTAFDSHRQFACSSLDFLEPLVNLRVLNLRFDRLTGSHAIAEGMQYCSQLTDLHLACAPLDTADLHAVLEPIRHLTFLTLEYFPKFNSLSFFLGCPFSPSLVRLQLHSAVNAVPIADLPILQRLRSLVHLHLRGVFNEAIDPATLSLFQQRPAAFHPKLEYFQYQHQDPPGALRMLTDPGTVSFSPQQTFRFPVDLQPRGGMRRF